MSLRDLYRKMNNVDCLIAKQGKQLCELKEVVSQTTSKLIRIQNADDYDQVISYYGATTNISTIVHTGTTAFGSETVTQTFQYVDNNVDDSPVVSISQS